MPSDNNTSVAIANDNAETNTTAPRDFRLGWLAWSHFLNDGAAFYLPGILPAVLTALHEPVRMVGVIMLAMYIGQTLQPVAGLWADKIGGKSLVVGGLLLASLGAALVGLSPNVWVLMGLLLASGLGSTLFHPQALAQVRSLTVKRHGMGMSLFLIGGELGRGIWPFISSIIVVRLGLPYLWLLALPTLLTLPLFYGQLPSLPQRPKDAKPAHLHFREHRRPFWVLVTYSTLRALVVFGTLVFIPIMWRLRGGALVSGASILTTLLITGIIGQAAGGTLGDKLGRRHVLQAAAALLLVLTPLLPLTHGFLLWVLAAALGIPMFATFSPTLVIGQEIFSENRALGAGIALGFSNGLGAIGLLPLGWVVQRFGIGTLFGILTAAAGLMLASSFLFSPKVHPSMN